MAKIRNYIARGTKPASLDRLEAALEGIVQSCQLSLGHLVFRIRQDEINLPFRQSWRCIARDAAVLDANADRLHWPKNTSSSALRERGIAACLSRWDLPRSRT